MLKARTVPLHLSGISTPLQARQLVYRTTDGLGRPSYAVTSVISAPGVKLRGVISYQSAYDSMDPEDGPSRVIAGHFDAVKWLRGKGAITDGRQQANVEVMLVSSLLSLGYAVNVPDTEGPEAALPAGPLYGMTTLDSLRAASRDRASAAGRNSRLALIGYSGGAIASSWAAALAPSYAPDINRRLVGVSMGGMMPNAAHTLEYINGSDGWAKVIPMALVGLSRAYDIDLNPYLNAHGKQVLAKTRKLSIFEASFPNLTWASLVKPQYANPNSVPAYVEAVNKLNLGTTGSPTVPLNIVQGAHDAGTGSRPGRYGHGDGVMIAGDVRTLARQYCADGTKVQYTQRNDLEHGGAATVWAESSLGWITDRFAGAPAPQNCSSIAPGNKLTPERLVGSS